MSRDASITFEWGDGPTTFRLGIGEMVKLQEARDCGPYALLNRLASADWRVEDVREVIRWGLVGGGKTPVEAAKLLKLYFEEVPPNMPTASNLLAALRIIGAGCVGAPDEPPGEAAAPNPAGSASTTSPTAS